MDKKDLISSHHSNVYGNFLMHWKYIKREKVGDKWKYTYKDDAVDKARTNLGKSVINYKKAVATENKLKADKTHDGELSKANLDMGDARIEAYQATRNAKRAVEKARKEYDAAKEKSDASIGNRITKALNGEKSTKEIKNKGVVEKQLSNGVTYTVPYDEKLDGPIKEDTKTTKTKTSDDPIKSISDMTGMKESSVKELQKLGQTDGYDSDKFKDLANILAEGDEDTYKKIVNIIKDSDKTKKKEQNSDDPIKLISDMTGMKESSVKELQKLGQTDGYDSDKFKSLANDLAEGDEDTYKKIVNIIKDSDKTKGKERKSIADKINDLPGADKLDELLRPLDEYFRLYQVVGDPKIRADGKIPDTVRKLSDKGRDFVDRFLKR